jgi:hypothetical protein
MHQAPNAWVPVHRYVSTARLRKVSPEIKAMMKRSLVATYAQHIADGMDELDLETLEKEHGLAKTLTALLAVDRDKIKLEYLRKFLAARTGSLGSGYANTGTAFAKAVSLYDRLKYGKEEQ